MAHQLAENFGSLDRASSARCRKSSAACCARLRPFGVWFGRRTVYLPQAAAARCGGAAGVAVGRVDEAGARCPARPRRA